MPTASTSYEQSFRAAQQDWEMSCLYPRERPAGVCGQCGEEGGLLFPMGMELLCPDCLDGLRKRSRAAYYEPYTAAHPAEFYIGWWLDSLPQVERGALLLRLLEEALRSLRAAEQEEIRADFCTASPDFYDYLDQRLGVAE